jgi:hypothetical protein
MTREISNFPTRKEVALPFNLDGLGDHLYVLKDTTFPNTKASLQTPPDSDSDSRETRPRSGKSLLSLSSASPLIGLDLYCGGDNFGRGLEEAGIVEMG